MGGAWCGHVFFRAIVIVGEEWALCFCLFPLCLLFLLSPAASSLPLYSPVRVLASSFGAFVIENETESLACSSVCLLIGNTN